MNGYDFVLYAGPQWDNATDGYYRGDNCRSCSTPKAHGFSIPSTRTSAGSRELKAIRAGTNHPNVTTDTTDDSS